MFAPVITTVLTDECGGLIVLILPSPPSLCIFAYGDVLRKIILHPENENRVYRDFMLRRSLPVRFNLL